MTNNNNFYWNFQKLPFIYTELEGPDNALDIPNALPFQLKVDENNGVLSQIQNDLVKNNLTTAYNLGSVIAGVIDEESGITGYANDFVNFFKESVIDKDIETLSVLEIGSGTGFLLSQVEKLGAKVIGVEPGAHCIDAKEKYGVNIVQDWFPSQSITSKFDIIIMTHVLEHIPEPSNFLKSLHGYLKDDGQLIISVPDEEPFIKYGDISTLFHEHYSYFTKDTINYCLKNGEFEVTNERFGKYGGVLLRSAIKNKTHVSKEEIINGNNIAANYKNKAILYNSKLKYFLIDIKNKNKTLGVYVPARFINILYISQVSDVKIRFFDDNPTVKNKYYPGFDIPIENKQDLIDNPVDVVLIFSKAFGSIIKDNLEGSIEVSTEIITWEELFDVV